MEPEIIVVTRYGEQKHGHNLLVEEPHQSSFAAMLLLRRKLALEEGDEEYLWKHSFAFRDNIYQQVIKRNKKQNKGKLVCEYCGKQVIYLGDDFKPYAWAFQMDHIIPKAKGGPLLNLENLASCCVTCNRVKGTKLGYRKLDGTLTWEGKD